MLCFCLVFNPLLLNLAVAASVNDIVVDSNAGDAHRPHLTSSADGVDVINITTPNSNGVSVNHYQRLNNRHGLIFNNSQYDGNSNIGGFVNANSNISGYGSRAASVILNQVNGTSRSHFSNVSEVFGSPSKLIISNPNGVTCNGCSFINAPKVTLTTGKPSYGSDGNWTGNFAVNRGDVIIGQLGLLGFSEEEAKNVSYVDIIARSAKIVGDLTAKSEVNIITGDVNYDYNTDGISKNDNADVNAKPEIAIDAAVFGSITAGRIRIIANEDGVGVKSHSTLTSNAEDIIIKANGEIEVRNVKAANDVKITSNKAANIKVVGNDGDKNVKIRADRDVVLTSNGDIVNEGIIEADYDVKLSADNNITNNNIIRANHNVELTKALNLVNNKDVEANNDLIVKNVLGGVSINGGSFVANNDINISDSGYLVLTNSLIQAKNNASILLNESLTNGEGSRIHADNYLHITSSTFNNAGLIDAGNNVRIKTTNASTLIANQIADFNHQIHHIDLQIQKLNADLVPDNNPNRKWFTVSEQTQNLINQLQIKRSELIQKRNAFGSASNIAATDIINSGLIYSGNELSLYSANNIANYNTIFANSNIYLGDEKIDQKFLTDINLNADVSNIADLNLAYSFTNYSAKVETSGDLNVHLSGGFNNRRTSMKNQIGVYNPIPSKPSIDININGYASTTSEVIANNINVISDSFLNDSSSIIAAGNIDIKTNSFLNLAYLLNGGRIGVTYERDNINGDYYDHRNINDPYYSTIKANGDIDITVNGVKTSSNSDSNPNDIVGFINSGSIYGGQTLTINVDGNVILSGSLDNIIIKEKVIDLSSLTPKVDGVVIRINQNGVADLDDPSYGFYLVNQIYEFDPKKYTSQSRVINDIRRLMSNPNLASKVVDCIHGGQSMEACVQSVRNEDIVDNVVNEIDQKILIQTDPKTLNDTIRRAALAYSSSGSFTGANTAEEDRNNLSNNAIEFVIKNRDLGLKFGESLTEDQIAKLDKPILWYERKTIDGKTMLVAKIYTPLKDDNNNINGTISGGEVNIASTNDILISNGSLGAAGDINLNADGKVSIINDKAPEALLQASNFTASAVTDQTPKNDANTTISGITFNAGTDINISGSEVNITNDLSQAGGSIFITSTVGDINNINYQIAADQNIILNSANDINNIYADSITSMHAGNVLSLNAQNDINNRGASLNGDNLVYLVAGNNINNEALIQREVRYSNGSSTKLGLCSPLGGQGGLTSGCSSASANRTLGANNNSGDLNITSTLIARGEIKSTSGNVVLVANNDINNVASDIISDNGQIYLEATTGDVNIVTDVLRNRSVNRWKHKKRSGIKITDVTTNVASNIQSAGNINIISGGDTNIKGSNVTSTGGGLNVDATGDLNILAVEDSYYRHESSNKKGSFGRKSKSSYTRSITTQKGSNINVANDINSDIKKNINISASDLTAGGVISLVAGEKINLLSEFNTGLEEKSSYKEGTTIIKTTTDIVYDAKQVNTNLNAGGNISLTSTLDTNLVGANLTSTGAGLTINSGGDINVYALADRHYEYHDKSKVRNLSKVMKRLTPGFGKIQKVVKIANDLDKGGLTSGHGWNNYIENVRKNDLNRKRTIEVVDNTNYQKVKIQTSNGDVNLTANNNIDLIGSDITSQNTTLTATNGDVYISNVKDSNNSYSSVYKSHGTIGSFVTDIVKNAMLSVATGFNTANVYQNPTNRRNTKELNEEYMGYKTYKQKSKVKEIKDETVISSDLNSNNITINANNTNITSTNLNANNNLDINSTGSTNITTAVEIDSSYEVDMKKNPNTMAAFTNGLLQVVSNWAGDYSFDDGGTKEERREQRNQSPVGGGYTTSNNEGDEIAYDTDLVSTQTEEETNISSNLNAGSDVNIDSTNGNNLIVGSNIKAVNDVNINSTNGTTIITSAKNSSKTKTIDIEQDYSDVSAGRERGRFYVEANTDIREEEVTNTNVTQLSSNIMSGGNVNITAQDNINILSSNLSANDGINLTSNESNVNILANSNDYVSHTELREGEMSMSVGIGNSAIDAGYATKDVVTAGEAVNKAKKNLNRIKKLKKEGKADEDAVRDAEANLVLAIMNFDLANLKAAAAAEKAVKSISTLGFYIDAQIAISGQLTNTTISSTNEIGSSLLATNNINIMSGANIVGVSNDDDKGNTNVKGTIFSNSGDITITSKGDTNIMALKNSSKTSVSSEGFTNNMSVGSSVGRGALQNAIESLSMQIAINRSKTDADSIYYNNTTLNAKNGLIRVNSFDDTNIVGSNLLASDILLNTQGDLLIESLQNKSGSKTRGYGFSGGGANNSVSAGFNYSNAKSNQYWVDNQASIVGTNSVTINTGNNTHIQGALLANAQVDSNGKIGEDLGNLTLNTKTLTYRDIDDSSDNSSESYGMRISNLQLSNGSRRNSNNNNTNNSNNSSTNNNQNNNQTTQTTHNGQETVPIQSNDSNNSFDAGSNNPTQDRNYYPEGNLGLQAGRSSDEAEQITRATIGDGTITTGATLTFDANGNLLTNIGGTTLSDDDIELVGLNRDITKRQTITKNLITGALELETIIDTRLLDPTGKKQIEIFEEFRDYPINMWKTAGGFVDDMQDIIKSVDDVFEKIIPHEISDPHVANKIREAIRQAALDGNTDLLKEKIKKLTGDRPSNKDIKAIIDLNKNRNFATLLNDSFGGDVRDYKQFAREYFMPTGIFFDGTGNDRNQDYSKIATNDASTNVFRMHELYDPKQNGVKEYITGVGTGEGWDSFCLVTGCGINRKQKEAADFITDRVINNSEYAQYLFAPLDVVGFSRGATTALDFVNKVNNDNYWNLGIMPRSTLIFDPVASYGVPGNNLDLRRDFSSPKNVITVQINALDERRNQFDLQDLRTSSGQILNPNWHLTELPGVHSTIGGGYKEGEQGKGRDMAFYAMELMVNQATEYGIEFADIPVNQQPSARFNHLINNYITTNRNYQNNPTQQNKLARDVVYDLIRNDYVHQSSYAGHNIWYQISNYDIGNERGVFNPNDRTLLDLLRNNQQTN